MSAPPGSASFQAADVARLSRSALRAALAPGPAAPPLEEIAAALCGPDLFTVAAALDPARGERLLRLGQRPVAEAQQAAAAARLVRGLFWPLVYELASERWAALAEVEVLPPALVDDLPSGRLAVEAGAGSGRLTGHLARNARHVLAHELSVPLCRRLRDHFGENVTVVAAASQRLPVRDGAADVAASCAALSPDPPLGGEAALGELRRVTRPGGWIVIVGPESPEWFVERGFERRTYEKPPVAPPAGVVEFFGPLDPPDTLLVCRA